MKLVWISLSKIFAHIDSIGIVAFHSLRSILLNIEVSISNYAATFLKGNLFASLNSLKYPPNVFMLNDSFWHYCTNLHFFFKRLECIHRKQAFLQILVCGLVRAICRCIQCVYASWTFPKEEADGLNLFFSCTNYQSNSLYFLSVFSNYIIWFQCCSFVFIISFTKSTKNCWNYVNMINILFVI